MSYSFPVPQPSYCQSIITYRIDIAPPDNTKLLKSKMQKESKIHRLKKGTNDLPGGKI